MSDILSTAIKIYRDLRDTKISIETKTYTIAQLNKLDDILATIQQVAEDAQVVIMNKVINTAYKEK